MNSNAKDASNPSSSRAKAFATSTKAPYNPRRRTQSPRQRILIVGGSIHGLILALLLQKLRIDFLILERSCEYGVPLNGTVLGSFAVNLLEMLGLVDQIKARSTDVHRMKIWRENGTIQAETDFSGAAARYSHNGIAIGGRVLQDILREQVPGHKILFGKEVRSYVQDEFEAARLSAEDRRPDGRTCSVIGVTRVLDDLTILDPDTQTDVFELNYINTQVVLVLDGTAAKGKEDKLDDYLS
ncbi:hypothetical protein BGZ95_007409 [Linnemannia exigua]|uniref:FAD-binding domain-containing protein n=1 Tax=Linnemannia exigua TaxID=604196 RepID=A0AAD4DHB7_9FUNG|nr:hypothetical protein BGZ95_007409 [Linnemannia exigua]